MSVRTALAIAVTAMLAPSCGSEIPAPPGNPAYASIAEFSDGRYEEFPALQDTPPARPVYATGRLNGIVSTRPHGTGRIVLDQRVMRLRVAGPRGSPEVFAYLPEPLDERTLAYLRTLKRGDIIMVTGIGHGHEPGTVYIEPVHTIHGPDNDWSLETAATTSRPGGAADEAAAR